MSPRIFFSLLITGVFLFAPHTSLALGDFTLTHTELTCIDDNNIQTELAWTESSGAWFYDLYTTRRSLDNSSGGTRSHSVDNFDHVLTLIPGSRYTVRVRAFRGTPWYGYTKKNSNIITLVIPSDYCSQKTASFSYPEIEGYAPTTANPFDTVPGIHPDRGVAKVDPLSFGVVVDNAEILGQDLSVYTVVSNTLRFDDFGYADHMQLGEDTILVQGINAHPALEDTTVVGVEQGFGDGALIHEGDTATFQLNRKHVRKVSLSFDTIRTLLSTGNSDAAVTLKAYREDGQLVASTTQDIYLDQSAPDISQSSIELSAIDDIKTIAFSVISARNATHVIEQISLTERIPMEKRDGGFFTSQTFPKDSYSFVFEADHNGVTDQFLNTNEGEAPLTFKTGYSSIAFIPGVKSSRLFQKSNNGEEQLWEPGDNSDVESLELSFNSTTLKSTGVHADIYTKDGTGGIIDEVNSLLPTGPGVSANIYIGFINHMNEFVASEAIAQWKALPYDWRLGFKDTLDGGVIQNNNVFYDDSYTTDTPYLYEELKNLALQSDSGKVSIVAHSMGGLLTKKLLHDVEHTSDHPYKELLNNQSIDTVFLVASPQLGTPATIPSILHGYKEDKNIYIHEFISKHTARNLANSMESAYNLLPSRSYTTRVHDLDGIVYNPADSALVSFDEETLAHLNDSEFDANDVLSYYGGDQTTDENGATSLRTYDDIRGFLTGADGRNMPDEFDFQHPTVLNNSLLDHAEQLHGEIDKWSSPDSDNDGVPDIRIVQIAGWGVPDTIKGLTYFAKEEATDVDCSGSRPFFKRSSTPACEIKTLQWVLDMKPDFTYDGDSTVVVPSAVAMGTKNDEDKRIETYYVDLFGYNKLLSGNSNRNHGDIFEISETRKLITSRSLNNSFEGSNYEYISSQIDDSVIGEPYLRLAMHSPVDVMIQTQDGKRLSKDEKTIPNSYYTEFGEGKYLGLPINENIERTIGLSAYKSGSFTFELTLEKPGSKKTTQTFANVPVSTTTTATLSISDEIPAWLALDHDADNTPDVVVLTKQKKETITFDVLLEEISTIESQLSKSLYRQAMNAKRSYERENMLASHAMLNTLKRKVESFSREQMPDGTRISKIKALYISAILSSLQDKLDVDIQLKRAERKEAVQKRFIK